MTEEQHNGNRAIAKYMGAMIIMSYQEHDLLDFGLDGRFPISQRFSKGGMYPGNCRYWSSNTLKFHESWEWLMEVAHWCNRGGIRTSKFSDVFVAALIDLEKESLWNACVGFVKLYGDVFKSLDTITEEENEVWIKLNQIT